MTEEAMPLATGPTPEPTPPDPAPTSPAGEPPLSVAMEAEFTIPPPDAASSVVVERPIDMVNTDSAFIFSILQGGPKAYFKARDLGIKPAHVHDDYGKVYTLFETFVRKGRLPTTIEIKAATGVDIVVPIEPFDVDLFAGKVQVRALYNALKEGLRPVVYDKMGKSMDPKGARDLLIDLIRKTSFAIGGVSGYNDLTAALAVLDGYERAKAAGGGLLGLSSPWPNVDKYSLGLQPGELTVIMAKRKVGKTISGETLCHDPVSGRERTISELVTASVGDVYTMSPTGPIISATPTAYMDCGEKECLKITWRSGREMIAAPTHPFLTPSGFTQLGELVVGHHTAAVKKLPEPLKPMFIQRARLVVLAYIIADGGCTKLTPTYTKTDQALVDELRAAVSEMSCKLVAAPTKGQYSITGDEGPNFVTKFLTDQGVMGEKSVNKVIPAAIFSLPNEQLGLFLGRLWSGDGCVASNGVVSYSTGSHRMALQIQHLLLRFGIASRVRPMHRDTDHETYYELAIHREDIESFRANVKLIGEKAARLADVTFEGRSRVGWIKNEEMCNAIRSEMDARPDLLPLVGEELGYEFAFQKGHIFDSKSGRVQRHVFRAFAEVYNSGLKWVLDENISWDEIESIEPAGKHHCYDLTVEPTACYVANDYVVHNSWILFAWWLHILKNDLKPGESLFLVSMEMPKELIYRRLAAIDLRLCYSDFRGGRLTIESEKRLYDWVEAAKTPSPDKPNIYVAGPNTIRDVADIAAKTAELNPRAVGIDGLYILGRDAKLTMHEKTLKAVSETKLDLCANLNVPVVATTQLKGSKDKRDLSADADDAAYAKAIGDYADAMRGAFMDDQLEKDKQRIFTGMESREFRPVDLAINFNLDTMDFSEIRVYTAEERAKAEGKDDKGGKGGSGEKTDEEDRKGEDKSSVIIAGKPTDDSTTPIEF